MRMRGIPWALTVGIALLTTTPAAGQGCGPGYPCVPVVPYASGGVYYWSGYSPRAGIGAVLGGVLGGIAGSQIGRGAGRTAGIVGGVLLGAIVGHDIGRSLDRVDELNAQRVLEENRVGQPGVWVNPGTQAKVVVTPLRTYPTADQQYCREYSTEVTVGGQAESAYGTACRQPDGSWRIVN